jgi:hypothetical protein
MDGQWEENFLLAGRVCLPDWGLAMRFPFVSTLPLLCACTPSPLPATDLTGSWTGNAVTTFEVQRPYAQKTVLDISVSDGTATISGVCGGTPAGPETVNAQVSTIGSGTFASYSGSVSCPPRRLANCPSVVFTYTQVAVLAGVTNDSNQPDVNGPLTLSFAASGTSDGCGLTDSPVTVLIGYQTAFVNSE